MRVLVTGATGFLGRAAVRRLAEDHEVIGVARAAPPADLPESVSWVQADLSQPDFSCRLPERVDAVLHMAVAAPSLAPEPTYAFRVNAESTLALLEYVRDAGAERFIYTSSGSVYRPQAGPISEDTTLDPVDLLGVSKLASERLMGLYREQVRLIILRLFHPYGPGQPANLLVARLAERVRAGEEITVARNRGPLRSFLYVEDFAEVAHRALNARMDMTVNVAHPEPATIADVCERLAGLMGVHANIAVEDRDAPDLVANVDRLADELDYQPRVALDDGLWRMVLARAPDPEPGPDPRLAVRIGGQRK